MGRFSGNMPVLVGLTWNQGVVLAVGAPLLGHLATLLVACELCLVFGSELGERDLLHFAVVLFGVAQLGEHRALTLGDGLALVLPVGSGAGGFLDHFFEHRVQRVRHVGGPLADGLFGPASQCVGWRASRGGGVGCEAAVLVEAFEALE